MAKETVKTIALIVAVATISLTTVGGVVAVAWTGSERITGVEKDIKGVGREVGYVLEKTALNYRSIETTEADIKKLNKDISEAKLRDERIASQFALILSFMESQDEKSKEICSEQKELGRRLTGMEVWVKGIEKVD